MGLSAADASSSGRGEQEVWYRQVGEREDMPPPRCSLGLGGGAGVGGAAAAVR